MTQGEKLQRYLRAIDRVIDASPPAQAKELETAQLRMAAEFRKMQAKQANADTRFVAAHTSMSTLLTKATLPETTRAKKSWRDKLFSRG